MIQRQTTSSERTKTETFTVYIWMINRMPNSKVQKLIRGKTPKSNNRYIDFNAVESIKASAIEERKNKSNWVSCLLMTDENRIYRIWLSSISPSMFHGN